MAQQSYDNLARFRGLKLETHADEQRQPEGDTDSRQTRSHRPRLESLGRSEDNITQACATPPIEIPHAHEHQHDDSFAVASGSPLRPSDDYVGNFLRDRQTSIAFDSQVRTSSGHRHSILEPPKKVGKERRGRSLAQALQEHRTTRPHSESDRSHYDPFTGRQLPQWSDSPPSEQPRVGEARFPLLQQTVDILARQQSRELPQPMSVTSMTSDETVSPVEEVVTPQDHHVSSPIGFSLPTNRWSSSYESLRPKSKRKASERWREGEGAPDFFSRAGSLKKGDSRRTSRRDTPNSVKSPHSAASSFLRGFSVSSHGEGDGAPPAVDGEGATVGEDYVLGKQIGYGGFSIIREVKHMDPQTGNQRTLAVKIVRKQIEGKSKEENDTAQSEFEHEVDLWRLLNHKHILSLEAVYDLKEATFCFVPLNTGGTLFDIVSNNRQGLPQDVAANYSYQIASALRYLHLDARVVHRDIKLENCLVDDPNASDGGLVRLCDFGLAEWISNDSDSSGSPSNSSSDLGRSERTLSRFFGPADSSTSAFLGGSLEYAAPEILKIATSASGHVHPNDMPPQQSIISPAVDIWAMGVCMFAMLTGRRPFHNAFQPRVVMAILAGDWNKQSLKDKVDEGAYKLIRSCMSLDAYRRPSISEVFDNSWFDDVRSVHEDNDVGSESGRLSGWRL